MGKHHRRATKRNSPRKKGKGSPRVTALQQALLRLGQEIEEKKKTWEMVIYSRKQKAMQGAIVLGSSMNDIYIVILM